MLPRPPRQSRSTDASTSVFTTAFDSVERWRYASPRTPPTGRYSASYAERFCALDASESAGVIDGQLVAMK